MQADRPGAQHELGQPDEEVSHPRAIGRQAAYAARFTLLGILTFMAMGVFGGLVVWFVFPATIGLGAWGTAIRYSLIAIAALLPALFFWRWMRRHPAPTFPQTADALLGYVRPPNISRMCALSVLGAAMLGVEMASNSVSRVPAVGGLPQWSMIFVTALAFLTVPGVGPVLAWLRAHRDEFDDDMERAVARSREILIAHAWLIGIGAAIGITWTVVILDPLFAQLGVFGCLAIAFNTIGGFLFMPIFLTVMSWRMIRQWEWTALSAR